jgi:pimeloyl-ACP methyl ester carboxylesterase
MFVAVVVALAIVAIVCLVAFTAVIAYSVERTAPPLGRWIDVDGTRLHYIDIGQGPPIVMIHGLGGQSRHFTYGVADRLKNDFRIVIFDRPGSGYSTRPAKASARLRAQAAVIADAMQRLGLERSLVVGHSMGGAIALAIAQDNPQLVRGLALIAPLTHPVKGPPLPFAPLAIPSPWKRKLVAWTVATPLGMLRGAEVLASVFHPEATPLDFGTKGGAVLGLRPSAFIAACEDLLQSNADLRDMTKRYGEIGVPVHALCGTRDTILDANQHAVRLKEALPSVEIEFTSGGHMPLITDPATTAAFIAKAAT